MSYANLLIEVILSVAFLSVGIAVLYITIGTYLQKLILAKDTKLVIEFLLRPLKIWANEDTKLFIKNFIDDPKNSFMLQKIKLIDECDYNTIIEALRKIDCTNSEGKTIYELLDEETRNKINTVLIKDPLYTSFFINLALDLPSNSTNDSANDELESSIKEKNKRLITITFVVMSIVIIISLIIALIIYMIYQPEFEPRIYINMFILLIIVLVIEFIFYKYVIGSFKPIDVQLIYIEILKSIKTI
jgi:hypothetical protein